MVGVAAWVRLVADPTPQLSGQRTSRSYDYTGFDSVEVSGQWAVTIERGDAWRVAIEVPAELVDEVEVELDANELSLGYDGGWFRDGTVLEVAITMPALESLDLFGSTTASFSGFEGGTLSVEASGGIELRGTASRFDTLILESMGAGNVDFSDAPVTNADVDVSGAGHVTLRMAGGRLTGDMLGAGTLEYYGPVSEQSVEASGFVNIRPRN
jgi:hypothetical protein